MKKKTSHTYCIPLFIHEPRCIYLYEINVFLSKGLTSFLIYQENLFLPFLESLAKEYFFPFSGFTSLLYNECVLNTVYSLYKIGISKTNT